MRRREPRSTTAIAMSSSSLRARARTAPSAGMVWMMSSSSCAGWLGSRCAIASASLTRREISGISSTLAFIAATVNSPTNRCSIGPMSGVFADHDDIRVGAVAQEAGDRGLREHQQVVAVGQLRQHLVAQPQHAQPARRVDRRLPAAAPGSADSPAARNARRPASAAAPRRPCGRRRGSVPPGRCRARRPGRAASAAMARSRAQPGGHRRARSATGRLGLRDAPSDRPNWTAGRGSRSRRRPSRKLSASADGLDVEQLTGRAAPHPEHRVHDRLVGHPEPVQQHGDGVHQHRRVVGDDLHRRAEAAGVVCGVDRDERFADLPAPAELVVGRQQGRATSACLRRPYRPGRWPPSAAGRRRAGRDRSRCRPWRVCPGWPGSTVLFGRPLDRPRPGFDRHATRS